MYLCVYFFYFEDIGKAIDENLSMWKEKKDEISREIKERTKKKTGQLSSYAADIFLEFFVKVIRSV